jgi:hypothetical protein
MMYSGNKVGKIFWDKDRNEYYVSIVREDTGVEVDRVYGGTQRECQELSRSLEKTVRFTERWLKSYGMD